ncbi:AarF/UbiB family protein [Vibrio sp. 1-Bac 57]
MSLEKVRQQAQLSFCENGKNIEVGDLKGFPITLAELKSTNSESHYVVETFDSGLTGVVYHLQFANRHWTLKLKRSASLVNNVDGQTSFLNEVQRRHDFSVLKQTKAADFNHIIETKFASYTEGIILSPWIVGAPPQRFNKTIFEQIFTCICNLELNGFFEWDLSPGNILLDNNNRIKLFDFGYMYQFNPLKHFNSNGQDTPLFHGIERFETRFFFDYLLKNPLQLSKEELFELYRLEKQCALQAYLLKLQNLKNAAADASVLSHQNNINLKWEKALSNEEALRELYLVENYRSNVLDLLDDLHGQSCNIYTLKKADLILSFIHDYFIQLLNNNAFFFGDEKLNQEQLIVKYTELRNQAISFQLGSEK